MKIPTEVQKIVETLKKVGFEAYVVGGCVRDLLRKAEPEDWDVATNARPLDIVRIFPKNFVNNQFGTVTVLTGSLQEKLKTIEITPYRIESTYTDKRHPDRISWAKTIDQDLSRRDFTINAIALKLIDKKTKGRQKEYEIVDPFAGQLDLKKKIIRAVADPKKRFAEDALRLMRAARFSITLGPGWQIEPETRKAIKENCHYLRMISKERIRDELVKMIMSERPSQGIEFLRELGLLRYIIPELEEGYGVSQNKHHIFECYEHSLHSLDYAAKKGYGKEVRIASLLHDIAKPRTKQGEGPEATFYGHEITGAKMTGQILNRLRFPRKEIEKIVRLVRYHLFYYNVGEVSESSVRRLVRKVGPENVKALMQVRYADRIGSGCPKAEPYKLRHLKYLVEKVGQDPISVTMLKASGHDVMESLKIGPGPTVGQILDILLEEVLEDPAKNDRQFLLGKIKELGELELQELGQIAQRARKEREKIEIKKDEMTKKKYWVT